MKAEDSSECIKIDPEKSIIVVSDLHLGALEGETTSEDFLSFLDWLEQLCDGKKTIEVIDKLNHPQKLAPAQMLILLGDILDFWVQREPLRQALFKDCLPVFSKLRDLPIPIVYVIGNHDREVYEINGIFTTDNIAGGKIIIEPDQFSNQKNSGQLINSNGLKLGQRHGEYVFLHGHQFDKKFRIIQTFSEFPGWVSNNSSVFEAHPWFRRISWFLFFFGIIYSVLSGVGLLSFLPSIVHSFIFVIFGISIPIFLISIPSEKMKSFYDAISKNSVGKWIQGYSYEEKGRGIKEIIARDIVRRNLKKEMDQRGKTNIVVFGHTHMPDCYKDPELKKTFINGGSWDSEVPSDANLNSGLEYHIVGKGEKSDKKDKSYFQPFVWNSFIYIDKSGPCHLVWDADNTPNPIARFLEIYRQRELITK